MPFGIVAYAFMLFSWTTFLETAVYENSYICTAEGRMNKRKIIAVIYATKAVAKIEPEKNPGLNGIRTHDLCDAGAVLYQLSYQANWEPAIL